MSLPLIKLFTHSKYSFEGKKDYEEVIVFLRRHWLVIFLQFLVFLILALIPLAIAFWAAPFIERFGLSSLFNFMVVLYFLFWWLALFYRITMYLLDTWLVTDHRIIDSEQHGFFNRTVAELNLSRIQDVSVKVSGLLPTFIDFGDLEVQTAGAENKFMFKQVPHPVKVKDAILKAHNAFVAKHPNSVEIHEKSGL